VLNAADCGLGGSGPGRHGWALSLMLVKVLTGVFDPPPAHLAWPAGSPRALTLAAVAASVVAGRWCLRVTRRPDLTTLRDL
jgi:putative ABC transport system permease protein